MTSPIRWHGPQRYRRSTSDIEAGETPFRRQVENSIPQGRFTHYLQVHRWTPLELHMAKDTILFECCSNERAH